ncbi:MAG: hypothetical protein K1X88_00745 [Nannocystaceae bacterium]|nr:hypothetical protein [Nannocystaceae bacterium]
MSVARDRLSPRRSVALFVGLRAFAPAGLVAPLPEPPTAQVRAPATVAAAEGLRWDAPPVCPSAAAVREAVAARLDPSAVTIVARVWPDEGGALEAEVEITASGGATRRTLRSPACESIVDAIVLLAEVTAATLPSRSELVPTPVPAPERVPPPAIDTAVPRVAELPARPPIAPAAARPRGRVRARLLAGVWIGGGTLPRIDAGVRVGVGLITRRIAADLGALGLLPQRLRPHEGVDVQLGAWALGARVCPTIPLPVAWLGLGLCASAHAGAIEARARGASVSGASAGRQPWLRLGAGPELTLGTNRWLRGIVALDAGGNPFRAGFSVGGLGTVWTPRPWAVHAVAGLEVRLP